MRLLIVLFTVAIVVLCGCNNNTAKKSNDALMISDAPVMDKRLAGKQIFEENCAACHGSDGAAGVAGAANLQALVLDSSAVIKTITLGKKEMPSFGASLSSNEINQVALYIKSLHK